MERFRNHDEESFFLDTGHGEIGFYPACLIHPLRVHTLSDGNGDVVAGDPVQDPLGAWALHQELGHRRHVEQGHTVADRMMLGGVVIEPVLTGIGEPGLDVGVGRGEPRGQFPPGGLAEMGPRRLEALVNRGSPDVARRCRV